LHDLQHVHAAQARDDYGFHVQSLAVWLFPWLSRWNLRGIGLET
jgi:hypothetical protein